MTIRKKKAPAKKKTTTRAKKKSAPTTVPAAGNTKPIPTNGPQFSQPIATPDPSVFSVLHGSDTAAYKILDAEKSKLLPRPFPIANVVEPTLTLAQALGAAAGASVTADLQRAGQTVFHVIGDTGNTKDRKTWRRSPTRCAATTRTRIRTACRLFATTSAMSSTVSELSRADLRDPGQS